MKRNFKRNFIKNGGGSGPLLNNPSNNLQDLDRELELLRRKRQMLENQQYQGGFNRPNPWDQPPRINEYNAPRAFSQPQYVDQYESPRRPQATSWQEPAAKRFRQQEFDSRPAPRPFQAQRPQQYPPPKSYNPPANFAGPKRVKGFVNPKQTFAPKQTAPKQTFAPKPAPQASPKFDKFAPKFSPTEEKWAKRRPMPSDPKVRFLDFVVSQANEPFPPVVKGRLEAVLGDLFRGLKERSNNQANVVEFSRNVKRVLRDRIRAAMRDKALGTKENVAAQYAKAYPGNDDAEVFRLAKVFQAKEVMEKGESMSAVEQENNPLLTNITTADSPEQYFLKNMEIVIGTKIDEILKRIEKSYEEDTGSIQDLVQKVDQISKEQEAKKTEENTSNAECASDQNGTEKDENSTTDAPTTDVPATEDSQAKPESENAEAMEAEEAAEATENRAEATQNGAETTENGGVEANEAANREEYYSTLMNALIRRELPKVLPIFKNYLVKLLNMDINYTKAQKFIAEQAAKVQKSTSNKKPEHYVMLLGEPQLPRKERLQIFLNKFNPASIKKHKRVHNVLYIGFSDKNDSDRIIAEDGLILAKMQLIIKENKNYRDNPLKIVNGAAKLIPKTAAKTGPAKPTEAKTDLASTTKVKTEEPDTSEAKTEEPDTSQVKTEEPDTSEALNSSGAKESAEDEKSLIDSDIDGQITDLLSTIGKSEDDNSSADAVQVDENVPENVADGNDVTEEQAEENNDATETTDENVTEETREVNDVEASEGMANGEEKAPEASPVTQEDKDASEVAKTPTRASTRLAGGIKTRRASRLAQ